MKSLCKALLVGVGVVYAAFPSLAEVLVYRYSMTGPVCVSTDKEGTFNRVDRTQYGYLVFEYISDLNQYNDATLVRYWSQNGAKYMTKAAFLGGQAVFKDIVATNGRSFLLISSFDGANSGNFYSGQKFLVRAKRVGGTQDLVLMTGGNGQSAYQTTYGGGNRVEVGAGNVQLRLDGKLTQQANVSGQTISEVVDDLVNLVESKGYRSASPVAVDESAQTAINTAVTVDVLSNDYDPNGENLKVNQIVSQPSNGSVIINDNKTVTYTPKANWAGTDTFTYQVINDSGSTDNGAVTITVLFSGEMIRVSEIRDIAGNVITEANGNSTMCNNLSKFGRYVVFRTTASNLVSTSTTNVANILLYDCKLNTFERINTEGTLGESGEQMIATQRTIISPDDAGRYVVFESGNYGNFPFANGYQNVYSFDRVDTTSDVPFKIHSVNSEGKTNGDSKGACASEDMQVSFYSKSNILVSNDTNGKWDVFVTVPSGTYKELHRLSLSSSDEQSNGDSKNPAISSTGRYVVFDSDATNLVADGTTAGLWGVFLRDRDADGDGVFDEAGACTTTRISVPNAGGTANGDSHVSFISADGRYVVFSSSASNLVGGDTNGVSDVFLWDANNTQSTRIRRVSLSSDSVQGNGNSGNGMISSDAKYMVYDSVASNLVTGDTNGVSDVFVTNLDNGATYRCSINANGVEGNGASQSPGIAYDGNKHFIVFYSAAENLRPDDNGLTDVFMLEQ